MTVAPRPWSQADSGTQALRVGSRMTVTDAPSGIFAHRRSRVVGRRAELPRRPDEFTPLVGQAGPVVRPTGDVDAQPDFVHGIVLSLGRLISRLFVVDRCTFRRGVTIQTFRSRGPKR